MADDLPRLALAGFSAAAVVLYAAGYAAFLVLGRARGRAGFPSYGSFKKN